MSETFRIHDEPMSFQDKAFVALCAAMVDVHKTSKESRQVTCEIQAAWDLSRAMASWRDKMTKEDPAA